MYIQLKAERKCELYSLQLEVIYFLITNGSVDEVILQ